MPWIEYEGWAVIMTLFLLHETTINLWLHGTSEWLQFLTGLCHPIGILNLYRKTIALYCSEVHIFRTPHRRERIKHVKPLLSFSQWFFRWDISHFFWLPLFFLCTRCFFLVTTALAVSSFFPSWIFILSLPFISFSCIRSTVSVSCKVLITAVKSSESSEFWSKTLTNLIVRVSLWHSNKYAIYKFTFR